MKDISCPYCGEAQDICNDDGFGLEEDLLHETECEECYKIFVFSTHVSLNYTPHKADCLNGAEHKLKPTHTIPKYMTKMGCGDCDYRRAPLTAERARYDIPYPPKR